MTDFEHITKTEYVSIYEATNNIFHGILSEVKELSKKKPDAILNAGKVKLINRILIDLKKILEAEPEGKFLDLLSDEDLPQTSDAVLVMVQFKTALNAFHQRYRSSVSWGYAGNSVNWITPELIVELSDELKRQREEAEEYDEDNDDE